MESHVVSIADKVVSIYEFGRYQVKYTGALAIIFTLEIINNINKFI